MVFCDVADSRLTDGISQTEGRVSDGVDRPVDSGVTDIHEEAQLGHHAGVHHADREAKPSVGDDQMLQLTRHGDLSDVTNIHNKCKERRTSETMFSGFISLVSYLHWAINQENEGKNPR